MTHSPAIPGYTYGTDAVPRSPVSLEEFELLKRTVVFGEEDVAHLQLSYDVLAPQVDAILDVWYGFVGSNPHLLDSFTNNQGEPDGEYLAAVRARFGQWILDTARARYDQAWLDYQHEVGLRHHRLKKNLTDGVDAKPIVPFRYVIPLLFPITYTLKPFLEKNHHSPEIVEKMHAAWVKSCLLQITLWSHPYVKDGDF